MDDLKQIISKNLIELRKRKKYTQLDVADMLQYSDKAISKWEKGDSLPDVETLYKLCNIYGVTLDYLTHEGTYEEKKEFIKNDSNKKNKLIIAMLFIMACWAVLIVTFTILISGYDYNYWILLVWGVPLTGLVLLGFNSIWGKKKYIIYLNSFAIWTALTALYFQIFFSTNNFNMWYVFLVGVPLQIAAVLWSQIE